MSGPEFKDYYKILGVSKTATEKEIKAAYRKLARKHHPDVNQGNRQAEARFKEINEANEVLSDPQKRRRYDELGANWDAVRSSGPAAGRGWPGGFRVETEGSAAEGMGGFSDFFRTFFSGGGGGFEEFVQQPRAGRQAVADHPVDITLEEVLAGAKRTLQVGGKSPHRAEVKIPAGVREGTRVRAGEVVLRVHILPHPTFEPKGDDLQAAVRAPLTTAVLGGEVQVPTLDGPVGIKVPAGTPAGRVFRLRGHGLPRLEGGGRGDLLATLAVELPRDLSPRERALFEELRGSGR
jgi:DnaJ-class molecular chaperone